MKYKLIKQHDENDCGVACLAMVSWFYKRKINYQVIKSIVETDLEGTSLESLVNGARKIGLEAEGLKGDFEEIRAAIDNKEISFPFIAHTIDKKAMAHYVVVFKITRKYVVIGDPVGHIEKITHEEFIKIWSGYIVSFCLNPDYDLIKKMIED